MLNINSYADPGDISVENIEIDVMESNISSPKFVFTCISDGSRATIHKWKIDETAWICKVPNQKILNHNVYQSSLTLCESVSNVECIASNNKVLSEPYEWIISYNKSVLSDHFLPVLGIINLAI